MSNKEPILYDFVIAVEKVETFHVRIRDDMRRGWDRIERRAIALVEEGRHKPYSTATPTEHRMGGSWIAHEREQADGAFQMRPGYCRQCGGELGHIEIRAAVTICEACERKAEKLSEPGLFAKYLVFRNDGDPIKNLVGDCFVLRPTTDRAAFEALWAYADYIEGDPDKQQLVNDLRAWLNRIRDETFAKTQQEATEPEKQGDIPASE